MPLVDHRSSKQLRSHTGAGDHSSRAFDVCGMNGHGPFVPLDPSADRISDLPVLHRKSLRVADERPPSGAACIIPFAFACTYEGAELHPRVLAIRRPFRVERDAIPDLLSRSPCSSNIRRNARNPCTCHSSALSCPPPLTLRREICRALSRRGCSKWNTFKLKRGQPKKKVPTGHRRDWRTPLFMAST
jgi:hypothetical protein